MGRSATATNLNKEKRKRQVEEEGVAATTPVLSKSLCSNQGVSNHTGFFIATTIEIRLGSAILLPLPHRGQDF